VSCKTSGSETVAVFAQPNGSSRHGESSLAEESVGQWKCCQPSIAKNNKDKFRRVKSLVAVFCVVALISGEKVNTETGE